MEEALLELKHLSKIYRKNGLTFHAVKEMNLAVYPGECVGLIGESGSGKSTTANMVAGLTRPTEGEIFYQGECLTTAGARHQRELRKTMQMVFQNPMASFSPKMRLVDSIEEGLVYHTDLPKAERRRRAITAMEQMGLPRQYAEKKVGELSGGECQRAAIARAILIEPALLICDEVTSALDVSVQAQIMELLESLRREKQMAFLFISHDLALVSGFCDRILVMKNGVVVEEGETDQVIRAPKHPYTRNLLESVLTISSNYRTTRVESREGGKDE